MNRTLVQTRIAALKKRARLFRSDLLGPGDYVWKGPVFIHIPKAAGSSIGSTGARVTDGHKPYAYYERWARGRSMPFTFAVVRHPYDRFVSAFAYLARGGGNAMDAEWARRHLHPEDPDAFAVERLPRREILGWLHFRPQSWFVLARDGTVGVDRILRFETLSGDWPTFAGEHGLRRELPGYKQSGRTPHVLGDAAKAVLQGVYAKDFELFGYER
jgi:hypothetical protein